MRVQIPAYHDAWMKGDRYGAVLRTYELFVGPDADGNVVKLPRARVLLDKSQHIINVILADCEVIE